MAELPWAIEAIQALGAAGGPIFAVLWWLERKERIDCQKTTKDLLIQVLTLTNQITNAVSAVTTAVTELRGGIKENDHRLMQLLRVGDKVA